MGLHIVPGFVHVPGRLQAAAGPSTRETTRPPVDWVAARALQVLAGHARQAACAIGAQARKASLADDQRSGADAAVGYLTGNAAFLRYDRALAAGWPIATGVIEGARRHLIGDRPGISGARWGLAGAEAVLKLRALTGTGDSGTYWRFHLAPRAPARPPSPPAGQIRPHGLITNLPAEEPHPSGIPHL